MFTLLFSLFLGCSVNETPRKPEWSEQKTTGHNGLNAQVLIVVQASLGFAVFRADDPSAASWIDRH